MTVTVAVRLPDAACGLRGCCNAASASAALLLASVSTSGLSCWKMVSRSSATTFFLFANHWRRRRPSSFSASALRSEEHTSELQSLMRISYAVFCLKKKNKNKHTCNTTILYLNNTTTHNLIRQRYNHST